MGAGRGGGPARALGVGRGARALRAAFACSRWAAAPRAGRPASAMARRAPPLARGDRDRRERERGRRARPLAARRCRRLAALSLRNRLTRGERARARAPGARPRGLGAAAPRGAPPRRPLCLRRSLSLSRAARGLPASLTVLEQPPAFAEELPHHRASLPAASVVGGGSGETERRGDDGFMRGAGCPPRARQRQRPWRRLWTAGTARTKNP